MKKKWVFATLIICAVLFVCTPVTALAVTDADVEDAVTVHGKDAVAGNLFIWMLCSISFLKMSQKIDSFMSSLGINVGHTGGSMLAEAMLTMRTIQAARHHSSFSKAGGGGGGGPGTSPQQAKFLQGGLAGSVSRGVSRNAAQSVTGQGKGGLGRAVFNRSVANGGKFATNITSQVAHGNIRSAGSMTGDTARDAYKSYMNIPNSEAANISNVEIGGGRITGMEGAGDQSRAFAMYSADQYTQPKGEFSTHNAADGTSWYKQYAAATVDKTPYMQADGSIDYKLDTVSRLPSPPPRKDRI